MTSERRVVEASRPAIWDVLQEKEQHPVGVTSVFMPHKAESGWINAWITGN